MCQVIKYITQVISVSVLSQILRRNNIINKGKIYKFSGASEFKNCLSHTAASLHWLFDVRLAVMGGNILRIRKALHFMRIHNKTVRGLIRLSATLELI